MAGKPNLTKPQWELLREVLGGGHAVAGYKPRERLIGLGLIEVVDRLRITEAGRAALSHPEETA